MAIGFEEREQLDAKVESILFSYEPSDLEAPICRPFVTTPKAARRNGQAVRRR